MHYASAFCDERGPSLLPCSANDAFSSSSGNRSDADVCPVALPQQRRRSWQALAMQAATFVMAGGAYFAAVQWPRERDLCQKMQRLRAENKRLRDQQRDGNIGFHPRELEALSGPYRHITGLGAHELPEMYGSVREKTIWAYWVSDHCRSAKNCILPPQIKLCAETIERNKGSFDFKIVHYDEIERYVNKIELPVRWCDLKPALQKDSLMNSLLARYGGVALDISTILLRPLDDTWDEMVRRGATFRGYMYRLNSLPWRQPEVTAVWFLMSRREGIFSSAVRSQVIGMGDRTDASAYSKSYLALGDQTLTPILNIFNYSLPKCIHDSTVLSKQECPEHEIGWTAAAIGPARNDTRLLLRDPRDGPQLPFAFVGMATWNISDRNTLIDKSDSAIGSSMYTAACITMKRCWEDIFLPRFLESSLSGEGHRMPFVKMFKHGADLQGKSREELLSAKHTFFYNWLMLAGLPDI